MGGAGGAPTEGVIRSLNLCGDFDVIGFGADASDLFASSARKKFLLPYADSPDYLFELEELFKVLKPDFVHFQNDLEILVVSKNRELLDRNGVGYFMPKHATVEKCVYKYQSYLAFRNAGLKVPTNQLIESPDDLKKGFEKLGGVDGKVWLRSAGIGGGGKGSLATESFDFAKQWIDFHNGWGDFLVAEMLTERTITWLSIWWEGELVVAQTRARNGWIHGNRAISGVTGVTKIGITTSNSEVDRIAEASVKAVDDQPHGIYGVDMAYDWDGVPNPTEINISRFFTTIRFFTEAGINFPELFVRLGLQLPYKAPHRTLNPLPDNLCWLRGMDREPVLTDLKTLNHFHEQ